MPYTAATMLTHCPICRYDLTGLPDQHRCPECGYDYDRDSEVIPLQGPAPLWLKIVFLFMVLNALLYFGRLIINLRADSHWVMLIAHLFVLISFAVMIFSSKPFAILRPHDVQIAHRRKITAQYSLAGVAYACPDVSGAAVRLLDTQQAEVLRIPRSYHYTLAANLKLAAAINNRLQARLLPPVNASEPRDDQNGNDSPAEDQECP